MQKIAVYAENLCRNLLFMQKLQTVSRKFMQKITVYAEIFRWVW